MAAKSGHRPKYERRPRPLEVCGVGNGSQKRHFDCSLPVAIKPSESNEASIGNLQVPAVTDSDLPGLLGLTALRKNREVLDFTTLKMHFCGPNDYELERALPEGTDTFQLETAPSGHIVLPCCEFQDAKDVSQHTLTLLSRQRGRGQQDRSRTPEVRSSGHSSSSSSIPPPPAAPPNLPSTYARGERLQGPSARAV